jgi:hypothetical protein
VRLTQGRLRWTLRVALAVCVLLAAGCAAVAPPQGPYWEQQLRSAVPLTDGPVRLVVAGSWLPDVQGFDPERAHKPLTSLHEGALVLTQTSAMFLEWVANENRYRVSWRLAYPDLARTRIDAYGANRRLVVTSKDHRAATFQLSGTHGAVVDRATTQQAAELLKKAAKP